MWNLPLKRLVKINKGNRVKENVIYVIKGNVIDFVTQNKSECDWLLVTQKDS